MLDFNVEEHDRKEDRALSRLSRGETDADEVEAAGGAARGSGGGASRRNVSMSALSGAGDRRYVEFDSASGKAAR